MGTISIIMCTLHNATKKIIILVYYNILYEYIQLRVFKPCKIQLPTCNYIRIVTDLWTTPIILIYSVNKNIYELWSNKLQIIFVLYPFNEINILVNLSKQKIKLKLSTLLLIY